MSKFNRDPDYVGQTAENDVPTQGTEADMLLYVLDGWLGEDDWSMPTFPYPETVRELLSDLRAGDDPRALRAIAKVARADSRYAGLAAKVPHHVARGS